MRRMLVVGTVVGSRRAPGAVSLGRRRRGRLRPGPRTPHRPRGFRHQEEPPETGGARARNEGQGVELESSLTHSIRACLPAAQGPARVQRDRPGQAQFDLGNLPLEILVRPEIKAETRFWRSPVTSTERSARLHVGPPFRGRGRNVFLGSALNFTRLFPIDLKAGNSSGLSFGATNLLDLDRGPVLCRRRHGRFFDMAQIGPLTGFAQVPLIIRPNAVTRRSVRGGDPFVTFSVMDPNVSLRPHHRPPNLFADGVTFAPGSLSSKYFGKTANIPAVARSHQ